MLTIYVIKQTIKLTAPARVTRYMTLEKKENCHELNF